jgi:hypothetical protein
MLTPAQLQPESFSAYPPEARQLAIDHLDQLRRMPLAFLPLLLREVIAFDWKFPAERAELLNQFRYLQKLDAAQFDSDMRPFAQLRLSPQLENFDWLHAPAQFAEQLSAHLWATHQIEAFRTASIDYVHRVDVAFPPQPPPAPRVALVILGRDAKQNRYPLFRKLRPHGTYFTNVAKTAEGRALFSSLLSARAHAHPDAYAHWHVDGAAAGAIASPVTRMSYGDLQNARDRLVAKMRAVMAPGGAGPEALRTMMAQMTPADLGLPNTGPDALFNRFQINILTEGSGTQLFSTTFVQWSAREILRRAQPLTLLLTYAPRQHEQSMQEQLSGQPHTPRPDPQGSLIDADMGAYYTWLNMRRLAGATQARFLAWFEEGTEAIAAGPGFEKARQDTAPVELPALLDRITKSA